MDAKPMFDYLQESNRRTAVEAAYQAVRLLFESAGEAATVATRRGGGATDVRSADAGHQLAARILRDIERHERRPIHELPPERIGHYTSLLTAQAKERFPKVSGTSRASDVLSEMRSSRQAL